MIIENLSTLKINRLTQEQYDRELVAGSIDESAIYLTPYEEIDWSRVYTKDNKPTPYELGAAPAGYGLGGSGRNCTDCNEATESGFYDLSMTCLNVPDELKDAPMIVIRGGTTIIQRVNNGTLSAQREGYIDGTLVDAEFGEWEWENPPMKLGVVYKTTKKYDGKAVYTVLQNLGNLPAKDSTKEVYVASGSGIKPTNYLTIQFMFEGGGRLHYGNTFVSDDGVLLCRGCLKKTKTLELISFAAVTDYTVKVLTEYTLD